MNNPVVDLKVDEAVIRALITKRVDEVIASQVFNKEAVLGELVSKMLNMRVDSDGKPTNSSYGVPYIQFASDKAMREAVAAGMKSALEARKDQVTAMVDSQIKKSSNKLAKALVSGLEESLKVSWTTSVKINLIEDRG